MRNSARMPSVLALAIVSASFVAIVLVSLVVAKNVTRPSSSISVIGNKDPASQKGKRTIRIFPHNIARYDDLDHLTKASPAVLIGSVLSQKSALADGSNDSVTTNYKVKVKEVIRGDLQKESVLDLRVAGAQSVTDNGSDVEVRMPDYWKMPQLGTTYVFFLVRTDRGDYALVGGPQGMFQISPTGIKPQGLTRDTLFQSTKDLELGTFLEQIRLAL
jgi:hypothetical protein